MEGGQSMATHAGIAPTHFTRSRCSVASTITGCALARALASLFGARRDRELANTSSASKRGARLRGRSLG